MKKYISLFLLSSFLIVTSCDDRFEELNTDPNRPGASVFDPNLLLPTISYQHGNLLTGYSGPILFQSMWIQALASTSTGGANYYSNADKYVISSSTPSYIEGNWNNGFQLGSRVNQLQVLAQEKGLTNLNAVGEIMKVSALSVVSDTYGDIPYSEALKAQEGISQPKYDNQAEVYNKMLTDLEAALISISPSGDPIRNDVMYRGDIAKWRRFGYSLMLKLGLRLTNANPSAGQSWINKAVAGGVFTSPDDDALVPSDEANGYSNTSANALNVPDDIYEVRWSKVMIDYLKATNDPRLSIVAEVPPPGLAANRNGLVVGNNDPAVQIGLPNGFDLRGGQFDITGHPDFPGGTGSGADVAIIGAYSRPTAIYRRRNAPVFILTYSEVQLLLADAAVRGFTSGSPADFYRNGVAAAFTSIGKFGGETVSNADAVSYLNANPLDLSATNASLKMINEQIWATTSLFVNFLEAWNNWKRTGFPVLTPVNFPGNFGSGQIPRRQPYPAGESTTNLESMNSAISRMGGDNWITRTWWDGGN
ncbi:SusD/RagB family nutrient-binding outer membrane lipoprotein [Aquiflexum sp. LQ15W]|uniref:SusD/RagB family nutrient-binding outer membrane lipoprotein n=1 Tax=Cognataquiflexum nitidum TaxID=2922272 RepID=UPI001F141E56|nr:SusD/RagB family nutrient-binding outer membrane lipoprotein [Cognataquiflexum nitidum]MCH6199927.1 SusD/RagB family nutrient-binding outer membrane lipoprotein [Cognataquiflexum nitidum]